MLSDAQKEDLKRIRRLSDQLCTGHAGLREQASREALAMDLLVLATSSWIAALAFVDPAIAARITPTGFSPAIWIGAMGLVAFVLTLAQMRLDLRGKAEAHNRAFEAYAGVKRDAARLLSDLDAVDLADFGRLLTQYDLASAMGVGIPEAQFERQKQRHLLKVKASRYLDSHPSANLALVRLRWFIEDNLATFRK